MLLMLDERDQSLVHRLLMATPEPGQDVLAPHVLDALARLVPCDLVELAELDRDRRADRVPGRAPRAHRSVRLDEGVLNLTVTMPAGSLVTLSFRRRGRPFSPRDVAVLQLVEPVVAGLIRGRARATHAGDLSGSERRVLGMVASGASNAEIAEQLSVSVSTVRKHLEHCYRKLGVTNRTAAVAALREVRAPVVPKQRESSRIG